MPRPWQTRSRVFENIRTDKNGSQAKGIPILQSPIWTFQSRIASSTKLNLDRTFEALISLSLFHSLQIIENIEDTKSDVFSIDYHDWSVASLLDYKMFIIYHIKRQTKTETALAKHETSCKREMFKITRFVASRLITSYSPIPQ